MLRLANLSNIADTKIKLLDASLLLVIARSARMAFLVVLEK